MVTETELLDTVVYSFKRMLVEIELLPAEQGVFLVALNTPFVHSTEGSTYNLSQIDFTSQMHWSWQLSSFFNQVQLPQIPVK